MAKIDNVPLFILPILLFTTCATGLKGKFVQINDIHYDPTYGTAGDSCFNIASSGARLKYGHYNCDAPLALLESALYKVDMESRESDTDFVVIEGDLVTHTREQTMMTKESALDITNTSAYLIKERIKSGVPIYITLGNHDYMPKNQLPPNPSEYYRSLANIFCPLIIPQSECTLFRQFGYYSHVIEGRMKVVIMNSNLYSKANNAVDVGDPDPAGQFAWLREQLKDSMQRKQMVHIFAHIPPGVMEVAVNGTMFRDTYNTAFNTIMRDFADVIIGVYSGHTHTDSFRIIYSKDEPKEPMVSALIAPSVTPQAWKNKKTGARANPRNPAIRSVHYTTGPKMILKDYTQFYLALDVANSKADKAGQTVEWQAEYHFIRSFPGVSDLTANSLHKLVTAFHNQGNDDFHKYFDLNSVSIHENDDKPTWGKYYCDCKCKVKHTCAIENVDYDKYYKCLVNDNGMVCAGCRLASFLWLPVVALVLAIWNI